MPGLKYRLPKLSHGEIGVNVRKGCGQGLWMVEITTDYLDTADLG